MPSSFYRDNCSDVLAFTLNDAIQRKLEVAPLPGSTAGGIVAAHSEILAMRMAFLSCKIVSLGKPGISEEQLSSFADICSALFQCDISNYFKISQFNNLDEDSDTAKCRRIMMTKKAKNTKNVWIQRLHRQTSKQAANMCLTLLSPGPEADELRNILLVRSTMTTAGENSNLKRKKESDAQRDEYSKYIEAAKEDMKSGEVKSFVSDSLLKKFRWNNTKVLADRSLNLDQAAKKMADLFKVELDVAHEMSDDDESDEVSD